MTKFGTRMNTPQQGAIQILIEEVKKRMIKLQHSKVVARMVRLAFK